MILLAAVASLLGCEPKAKQTNIVAESAPASMSKPVENIEASPDQKERRAKSEALCKSKGIPVYSNPNALFVKPEAEVTLRTKDEVVDRSFALLYIGLKSEGLEQVHLDKIDQAFKIASNFTPKEKRYVDSKNPSQQMKADANWRYEGLHVFLWALGFIDELKFPDQICVVADDVKTIYELGPEKFRTQAKLRTKAEIMDQADLILRLNWACVNARVKNEIAPSGLDQSVVLERHYALNWLIKYMDQAWDDVSTDT